MLEEHIGTLKEGGFRITPVRRAILELLVGAKKPISAEELLKRLGSMNLSPNKTTVYRELDFLEAQKLIRSLSLNPERRMYEITGAGHHHHLMCMKCEQVEDVAMEDDMKAYEKRLGKKSSFKILDHSLEFFGLCKNCQ